MSEIVGKLEAVLKRHGYTKQEIENIKAETPPEDFVLEDVEAAIEKRIGEVYVQKNPDFNKERIEGAKIEGLKIAKVDIAKAMNLGLTKSDVEKMPMEDFNKKVKEHTEKLAEEAGKGNDDKVKALQVEMKKFQDLNAVLIKENEEKDEKVNTAIKEQEKAYKEKIGKFALNSKTAEMSSKFQWGVSDALKPSVIKASQAKLAEMKFKVNEDGTLEGENGGHALAEDGRTIYKTLDDYYNVEWSAASKQNQADPTKVTKVMSGIEVKADQTDTQDMISRIEAKMAAR